MKFIIKWLIVTGAVLLTPYVVDGITISSFYIALIVAFVWGLISFFIKPILSILTLPINLLTLGLFGFVLNGLIFYFISSFIQGFEIHSFFAAVFGALTVSILTWIGNKIFIRK